MGSNGVTVTKFLQFLMILELYLELSYFLSQIFIMVKRQLYCGCLPRLNMGAPNFYVDATC